MKAAIYNPYLNTLGGGERYTLAFARVLLENGWEVDLEWKEKSIIKELEARFGLDLGGINIVSDIKRGNEYDLCFWVSDGSIPTLYSRKNFLHFQVPFHDVNGRSLLNKMKLFRVNKIICNSEFTKKIIDKEYGVNSMILYPAVPVETIKPKRKENIILSVGRFSSLLQSKSQDELIKVFKKMVDENFSDWELVLAGGVEVGANEFIGKIEKISEGYPISIIKSPDFKTLKDLYGKAKIFWSASGYGVDPERYPEKVEHFGITVVESMASGAVPIVWDAGGHREIISENENGFLWNNTRELIQKTKQAIKNRIKLGKSAREASLKYSYQKFKKETEILLNEN